MNKEYDIVITNRKNLKSLLKIYRKKLSPIKILCIEDLMNQYYFTYDKKTIYYLMKEKKYQYDVAKMYLDNLPKEEIETENCKIKDLYKLKEELFKNKLLIKNTHIKNYLQNKNILIKNYKYLKKEEQHFIKELEKIANITYDIHPNIKFQHKIISWNNKEEEVSYIAETICSIIEKNISPKKIKIYASNEYQSDIERIFAWYHIPVYFQNNNLYATKIGSFFLNHLDKKKEDLLDLLKETYPLENNDNIKIYNIIINILNNYTWIDDLKEIEPFLIETFKNTNITENTNQNTVELINDLEDIEEEDYVFLLGFNQGEIPIIQKEEDYFTEKEKQVLGLDTAKEKNQKEKEYWIERITSIKNLTITMKKNDDKGECYISSLNDKLNLEIEEKKLKYHYSNLWNKIELTKMLDTLIKYNELDDNISVLYQYYKDIPYLTFNNNYQQIDKTELREYLNHCLTLSYSSMNTYYQCSFRYYLNNILKLNIFKETFYTMIGKIFHEILSKVFISNINIKEEYQNKINSSTYQWNARELYFLEKLEPELEFIINTIKKQNQDNSLTKIECEKEVEVKTIHEDMEITFKGYVDKIMLNEEENEIAIIDYKTGNPDLNLNNIIYGLDLQLPVYIYLAKNLYQDARIIGFYLQKILNSEVTRDGKHTEEELKEEKLKLQGYTNTDLNLLKDFDTNYENSKMIKGMKSTSKGISSKKVLDDNKIEKLKRITENKIKEAILNITNANFDINPKKIGLNNLGCAYCTYKDICFMNDKNINNLKEYKEMEFLGGEE